MSETDRQELANSKRILVKIGSSSLSIAEGLDYRVIERLCDDIAMLKDKGKEFAIVSSGAVASGRAITKGRVSGEALSRKQALAAIGQGTLIRAYNDAFMRYGHIAAQILLTRDDIDDRYRYLNIRNTFTALFELGAVPIINENDTVRVEEIQFSDNDMLSAMILPLLEAQLLIILTDTGGVCREDPHVRPDTERIPEIKDLKLKDIKTVSTQAGASGRGGMHSKLMAAYHAGLLGVPTVIANARTPHVISAILAGEDLGTLIIPTHKERMSQKDHWIGFVSIPKGRVIIDDGAVTMLTQRGKSLLPAGVTGVEGRFVEGDTVEIVDIKGQVIAAGLSNFTSEDVGRIMGANTKDLVNILDKECDEEIVHRNNMILKGAHL